MGRIEPDEARSVQIRPGLLGLLLIALAYCFSLPAAAQSTSSAEVSDESAHTSGIIYDNNPFPNTDGKEAPDPGGSRSTGNALQEDARRRRGLIHVPVWSNAVTEWNDIKQRFAEDTGIRFGGAYGLLAQFYSDSPFGEKSAFSHKFALNVSAELVGRDTGNIGSLNLTMEDRRVLKNSIPPQLAGIPAGSIVLTTATWGEFDFGITQLYWGQRLFNDRVKFDIGRVFAGNYINPYPLVDDNRQFLNFSFSVSPTIPMPLRGAGAVANVSITDSFYARAGIYNANSEDTSSTIGNLFEEGETFQHLQLGLTGNAYRPASLLTTSLNDMDNVHLEIWHKDNQIERGIDESWGIAFNLNFMLNDRVMPFFRAGWSDGNATLVDTNVAAGVGLRPFGRRADLMGFGVGWADPSDGSLRDQYTLELFYRLELIENVAISPDIQMIINPSLDPSSDILWVGGLRVRTTF
jgi:carbohydrate-selective porin OprB